MSPPCDFEAMVEHFYRCILRPGDTAIDVGAHTGRHAMIMGRMLGTQGTLHVVEPLVNPLARLRDSYRQEPSGRRGMANLVEHPCALADEPGRRAYVQVVEFPEYSGLRERRYDAGVPVTIKAIAVEVDTLDRRFADLEYLRYIKIDAEGGEMDILLGGRELIGRHRPALTLEVGMGSLTSYGHEPEAMFDLLVGLQYQVHSIYGQPLGRDAFGAACRLEAYWDYIALPGERDDLLTSWDARALRVTGTAAQPVEPETAPGDPPFDAEAFPRRVNLGCGRDLREGWLNVDLRGVHEPDLVADACDLHQLPDAFYEELLAQDVLEHLPRHRTPMALGEWNRILKLGGRLVVRTTEVRGLLHLFEDPERQAVAAQEELLTCMFGSQLYEGDFHHNAFTEATLTVLLHEAGFTVEATEIVDSWLLEVTAVKTGEPARHFGMEHWLCGLHTDEEFLNQCYLKLFHRNPDPGGYQHFLAHMREAGITREQVIAAFQASDEYVKLDPEVAKE